jgi:multidrug transporter EmrE-like cation transporter
MTHLWPTAGFAACALISFALLTVALRYLEVGAAYAVWTGIGAAGAATVGMIFLASFLSAHPSAWAGRQWRTPPAGHDESHGEAPG